MRRLGRLSSHQLLFPNQESRSQWIMSVFALIRPVCLRSSIRSTVISRKYASEKNAASPFPKEVPQFSSAHSLDKIYPQSRLDIAAVPEPPQAQSPEYFTGYIPMSQLTIRYARSGGPGGQHAHKTNTKVNVSFHLESAKWIPESTRIELMRIHKNTINKEGFWSVKSEKTRMQTLNLADCLDKIRCYIQEATIKVPPASFEILEQRRHRAEVAAAARLQQKRMNSLRKRDKNTDISEL